MKKYIFLYLNIVSKIDGFYFQDNEAQKHKTADNGVAEVVIKVKKYYLCMFLKQLGLEGFAYVFLRRVSRSRNT